MFDVEGMIFKTYKDGDYHDDGHDHDDDHDDHEIGRFERKHVQ